MVRSFNIPTPWNETVTRGGHRRPKRQSPTRPALPGHDPLVEVGASLAQPSGGVTAAGAGRGLAGVITFRARYVEARGDSRRNTEVNRHPIAVHPGMLALARRVV